MEINSLGAALRYAALGYAVFPCAPNAKRPLTANGLNDATTDPARIAAWWTATPTANVAIATAGLLVLDLDTLPGDVVNPWLIDQPEKLLDLAAAPLAITPRGGRHYIFRAPSGKAFRNTAGKLAPGVDTRADGGYILVAPSRVDGKPYRWADANNSLQDTRRDALPEPPAWLVDMLESCTRAAEPKRQEQAAPAMPLDATKPGDDFCARASWAEILEPHGWAFDGLSEKHDGAERWTRPGKGDGVSATAGYCKSDSGRDLLYVFTSNAPPLEAEQSYSKFAAYATLNHGGDFGAAASALAARGYGRLPAVIGEADPPVEHGPVDPGPVPASLLEVPGFISDVMHYTLETAPYPEPVLAFGGALALQAFLASRKVRDDLDSRSSFYVLALANSGAGKDHPRAVTQAILQAAGLSDCLGDFIASGEGLEDLLALHPAFLLQIDEMDALLQSIRVGKDARWENIVRMLLTLYSNANRQYNMRIKAGRDHTQIDQPGLTIFGTAIPKCLYEAMSLKLLINGLFARLLILEAGKRGDGQDPRMRELPESIRTVADWWANHRPGEARNNLAAWYPIPRPIDQTADAAAIFSEFRRSADREYAAAEARDDQPAMALWGRAYQKARRLALNYACSQNHEAPLMTDAAAVWSCAFARHQTERMLFMAAAHVSENEFDAKCKRFVETLRKWREKRGDEWMPAWQLRRKLKGWTPRDHDEVRKTLIGQGAVECGSGLVGGRPGEAYRIR